MNPLVSVICLCYNHRRFVEQALESVLNQTYTNVELVVVDDFSTDGSVEVIRRFIQKYPQVSFLALEKNLGNCRAFNKGYDQSKGEFIIDLAADDLLGPDRIEKGVASFLKNGERMGIHFSDAEIINEDGMLKGYHSDRFPHNSVPQGNIYKQVLSRYFINSPTMMFRREVFEKLGGYDESLTYEDFDFWVRSSRYFEYYYSPEALVKRRVVSSSLGQRQYKSGSVQLSSTLAVCAKALSLNQNREENSALKKRVLYEFRQAFKLGEFHLMIEYLKLWRSIPS